MRKRQQVCFRPNSAVARGLGIAAGVPGAVICKYRVIREGAAAKERLDVRFGARVAWGVLESEFESVAFSSRPASSPSEHEALTQDVRPEPMPG